ncbi:MAG: OmpA family protein [Desulfobacteraceae bacterium]|nr:OmpA family protein [Desulfobacteraceae bacterium]
MAWMTTFNDLMTNLLVFFVLLFSMGSLDGSRFSHFQKGLQSAMGVLNEGRNSAEGVISDKPSNATKPAEESKPEAAPREDFQTLAQAQGLEAVYTAKGLHLTLNDELLFSSGSAKLTPQGFSMLDKIAAVIKPLNRAIRVEGHTDDRPIATERYPSNWELSTARAISVVNYFISRGGIAPYTLSAVGYGSVKPRMPNDTDQHRAMNRRVEIILGPTNPGQSGT